MSGVMVSLLQTLRSSFRTRAALQIEILALRHQIHVLQWSRPRQIVRGRSTQGRQQLSKAILIRSRQIHRWYPDAAYRLVSVLPTGETGVAPSIARSASMFTAPCVRARGCSGGYGAEIGSGGQGLSGSDDTNPRSCLVRNVRSVVNDARSAGFGPGGPWQRPGGGFVSARMCRVLFRPQRHHRIHC